MPPIDHVVLPAGEYVLRPPTAADAASARELLLDADVRQWMPGSATLDLPAVRDWCVRSADWSAGTYAVWAVDGDHGLVGTAMLVRIDTDQLSAWVAYRTAPWSRRRGVATASVNAVTRFAFDTLGLERLELYHAVANAGSCGVARRCEYPFEGLLRAGYRDERGRRWDTHLHAKLRPDLRK